MASGAFNRARPSGRLCAGNGHPTTSRLLYGMPYAGRGEGYPSGDGHVRTSFRLRPAARTAPP
ncbi:hypothetical protein SCATT_20190 [Streptantibioticus cattleyicolor NRRL 8057 = DSM 46488]|uniref:Uncharacterized protein n=1 Tax=Streptantibioticus cattleyicolor (strain ATCC 35852 / DSM 46488 / JCM 4925 / NBRC 14057 / NRRL 8057) TaxID=1003195 RepID=G8WWI3_STREN|nr:hypothetical protein SCATT_20190 [Streptantibioticus cattleyicolor NRRL 8057 = DSM 46488]